MMIDMAHSDNNRAEEYVKRSRAKMEQVETRSEAAQRGTRGRKEHKAGAPSSNKGRGGKLAR